MDTMKKLQRAAAQRFREMHRKGWTEERSGGRIIFSDKKPKQPIAIEQRFFRWVDGQKVYHGESAPAPLPLEPPPPQYPDD